MERIRSKWKIEVILKCGCPKRNWAKFGHFTYAKDLWNKIVNIHKEPLEPLGSHEGEGLNMVKSNVIQIEMGEIDGVLGPI